MILSILDRLNRWIEPFRRWVIGNHDNPMMWLGFALIGIIIFSVTFGILHGSDD